MEVLLDLCSSDSDDADGQPHETDGGDSDFEEDDGLLIPDRPVSPGLEPAAATERRSAPPKSTSKPTSKAKAKATASAKRTPSNASAKKNASSRKAKAAPAPAAASIRSFFKPLSTEKTPTTVSPVPPTAVTVAHAAVPPVQATRTTPTVLPPKPPRPTPKSTTPKAAPAVSAATLDKINAVLREGSSVCLSDIVAGFGKQQALNLARAGSHGVVHAPKSGRPKAGWRVDGKTGAKVYRTHTGAVLTGQQAYQRGGGGGGGAGAGTGGRRKGKKRRKSPKTKAKRGSSAASAHTVKKTRTS